MEEEGSSSAAAEPASSPWGIHYKLEDWYRPPEWARRQVPMCPAFSLTDYKVQSQTLTEALLDLRDDNKHLSKFVSDVNTFRLLRLV